MSSLHKKIKMKNLLKGAALTTHTRIFENDVCNNVLTTLLVRE